MTSISSAANSTNMSAGANIAPKTTDLAAQQSATSTSSTLTVAADAGSKPLPNTGDSTTVSLSSAAQDKLTAEQAGAKPAAVESAKTEHVKTEPAKVESTNPESEEESGDLESFVFGALGLDHPEEIDENGDPSYSAGQYVKAAATVGGMIAMFI
ncbi:hypothetical protein TUM4438_09340 [Shewanella sairae]|uniref:Uncharacterized protein n=1 Tax=Shewanella sairae TaxID=190310 RepID=A0ABQ4P4W1_9GAMM|nr:hypothetical protein [Shewanella sairae]MCL1129747.1 hypothetical protein [Shewanella sairae]GIU42535.1 hypothetical protein TUM4438_09340 [Shewanella sairae]